MSGDLKAGTYQLVPDGSVVLTPDQIRAIRDILSQPKTAEPKKESKLESLQRQYDAVVKERDWFYNEKIEAEKHRDYWHDGYIREKESADWLAKQLRERTLR